MISTRIATLPPIHLFHATPPPRTKYITHALIPSYYLTPARPCAPVSLSQKSRALRILLADLCHLRFSPWRTTLKGAPRKSSLLVELYDKTPHCLSLSLSLSPFSPFLLAIDLSIFCLSLSIGPASSEYSAPGTGRGRETPKRRRIRTSFRRGPCHRLSLILTARRLRHRPHPESFTSEREREGHHSDYPIGLDIGPQLRAADSKASGPQLMHGTWRTVLGVVAPTAVVSGRGGAR